MLPTLRTPLAGLLLLALLACKKDGSSSAAPPQPAPPAAEATTFRNPLLASGGDPWVPDKDGF